MTKGEAKTTIQEQEKKPGFVLADFLRDTKAELDKVVWPTRQQLIAESAVVIVMVVIAALLINGVDWIFAQLAKIIFK
ncbi:MAG: preprotein translocase subunit SecE [Pseudanabaenaceae cyanobacterium]